MAEQTESRIRIEAPPAVVMAVIADVAAYPQWNAEMRSVDVLSTDRSGRPQRVRFLLDASPVRDTYVLAYEWDVKRPDRQEVRWTLVEAQTLAGLDGAYLLAAAGDGATEVTYRLTVELKIPVLGMLKRKGERVLVDRALKGLKARVESGGDS